MRAEFARHCFGPVNSRDKQDFAENVAVKRLCTQFVGDDHVHVFLHDNTSSGVVLRGRSPWASDTGSSNSDFLELGTPNAPVAEITNVGMFCCELAAEQLFSDCWSALDLVQCKQRAQGNEHLVVTCREQHAGCWIVRAWRLSSPTWRFWLVS